MEIRLPGSGLERGPDCHPELRAVILSEAKDLCARRASPFAEFPLSEANGLRVTGFISKYLLLLDKAGPNRIALGAGIKGSLLPHCGITTHEYYLSDRLSEAHSLQLA